MTTDTKIIIALFEEHGVECEPFECNFGEGFNAGKDAAGIPIQCFVSGPAISIGNCVAFDLADPEAVPKTISAIETCRQYDEGNGCGDCRYLNSKGVIA